MQGIKIKMCLLISTDKITAFKEKLLIWQRTVNDNHLDI